MAPIRSLKHRSFRGLCLAVALAALVSASPAQAQLPPNPNEGDWFVDISLWVQSTGEEWTADGETGLMQEVEVLRYLSGSWQPQYTKAVTVAASGTSLLWSDPNDPATSFVQYTNASGLTERGWYVAAPDDTEITFTATITEMAAAPKTKKAQCNHKPLHTHIWRPISSKDYRVNQALPVQIDAKRSATHAQGDYRIWAEIRLGAGGQLEWVAFNEGPAVHTTTWNPTGPGANTLSVAGGWVCHAHTQFRNASGQWQAPESVDENEFDIIN